jgi:hypothetical protein
MWLPVHNSKARAWHREDDVIATDIREAVPDFGRTLPPSGGRSSNGVQLPKVLNSSEDARLRVSTPPYGGAAPLCAGP